MNVPVQSFSFALSIYVYVAALHLRVFRLYFCHVQPCNFFFEG